MPFNNLPFNNFNSFLSHDAFSNSVQSLLKADSFKETGFGAVCLPRDALDEPLGGDMDVL